jgi:hypothetical protein
MRLALIVIVLLSVPSAGSTEPADIAPARDPAIALSEEFTAALSMSANAGLIGFLARHPDSPEAEHGRDVLRARPSPDTAPAADPDGEVWLAFDQARIVGTPEAMEAFAARYPGHPLALEAARPIWTAGQ